MAAIFAIIAIYSQAIFAIVAISFFANIANNSDMKDLDLENRRWLAERLASAPRGMKGDVAKAMGKSPDVVARIINFSGKGEIRALKVPELHALARFFKESPPGLTAPKETDPPPERHSRELVRVPILDRISAGKLMAPLSQIPEREIKWLSLSGLGAGDFIGFRLDEDADSIDRVAPAGAVIVVDRSDIDPKTGKFYVFSLAGDVTTKQWQPGPPPYLAPFSWNPIHKPQFIKRKRELEVIGRVKRAVVDL